jgi:hypothetical protein
VVFNVAFNNRDDHPKILLFNVSCRETDFGSGLRRDLVRRTRRVSPNGRAGEALDIERKTSQQLGVQEAGAIS